MRPILVAIAACILAAALEGALAGRGVKRRFAELRLPRLSPPLSVWILIGAAYYLVCGVVIYRLLSDSPGLYRTTALVLVSAVLLSNAFWNYLFFRLRDLHLAFLLGLAYSLVAAALVLTLFMVDRVGAWWFVPYAAYLFYANAWTYTVLRLNSPPTPPCRTPA